MAASRARSSARNVSLCFASSSSRSKTALRCFSNSSSLILLRRMALSKFFWCCFSEASKAFCSAFNFFWLSNNFLLASVKSSVFSFDLPSTPFRLTSWSRLVLTERKRFSSSALNSLSFSVKRSTFIEFLSVCVPNSACTFSIFSCTFCNNCICVVSGSWKVVATFTTSFDNRINFVKSLMVPSSGGPITSNAINAVSVSAENKFFKEPSVPCNLDSPIFLASPSTSFSFARKPSIESTPCSSKLARIGPAR